MDLWRRRRGEEDGKERTALIKCNNSHLAGGEKEERKKGKERTEKERTAKNGKQQQQIKVLNRKENK